MHRSIFYVLRIYILVCMIPVCSHSIFVYVSRDSHFMDVAIYMYIARSESVCIYICTAYILYLQSGFFINLFF